jgi:hypothetical protein
MGQIAAVVEDISSWARCEAMATLAPPGDAEPSPADESAQVRARTSDLAITKPGVGPVWRQYLRAMGPGLVTGASDDDPSGIATYSQAGAQFGFTFLWPALLTLPLVASVQEICDRTALATGTGLGELAVKRFGRVGRAVVAVLLVALLVANALNPHQTPRVRRRHQRRRRRPVPGCRHVDLRQPAAHG